MLRTELEGLVEIGYEVELTGFDTIEIDTILSFDQPEPPVDDDVHLPEECYEPGPRDRYLDKNGKPYARGSYASHLAPGC